MRVRPTEERQPVSLLEIYPHHFFLDFIIKSIIMMSRNVSGIFPDAPEMAARAQNRG